MMNQRMEDKLMILQECLKAGRAAVVDLSSAFQVNLDTGRRVYIYVEAYDNTIFARYETRETDPEKQRLELASVQDSLQNELRVAEFSDFEQSQVLKNRIVFTSRVEIDPLVFYHDTILFGKGEETRAAGPPAAVDEGPAAQEAVAVIDPKAIQEVMAQLEAVDAKMMRECLDGMALKRSSVVRAALNRIYRSVGDAEELTASIRHEAEKIVSDADRNDLLMTRVIHGDGFLKALLDLLYTLSGSQNE